MDRQRPGQQQRDNERQAGAESGHDAHGLFTEPPAKRQVDQQADDRKEYEPGCEEEKARGHLLLRYSGIAMAIGNVAEVAIIGEKDIGHIRVKMTASSGF